MHIGRFDPVIDVHSQLVEWSHSFITWFKIFGKPQIWKSFMMRVYVCVCVCACVCMCDTDQHEKEVLIMRMQRSLIVLHTYRRIFLWSHWSTEKWFAWRVALYPINHKQPACSCISHSWLTFPRFHVFSFLYIYIIYLYNSACHEGWHQKKQYRKAPVEQHIWSHQCLLVYLLYGATFSTSTFVDHIWLDYLPMSTASNWD